MYHDTTTKKKSKQELLATILNLIILFIRKTSTSSRFKSLKHHILAQIKKFGCVNFTSMLAQTIL